MLGGIGRILVVAGFVLVALGLILLLTDRIPGLGRLPGDIVVKRKDFTLYLPITTSILLSIVLTVILSLFSRR